MTRGSDLRFIVTFWLAFWLVATLGLAARRAWSSRGEHAPQATQGCAP